MFAMKKEAILYSKILPKLQHATPRHNAKYGDPHSHRSGQQQQVRLPLFSAGFRTGCAEARATERRARAATSRTLLPSGRPSIFVRRFKSKNTCSFVISGES
jgi:hypothetical protein